MSLAEIPHDGASAALEPTVVQEEAIVDNLDLLLHEITSKVCVPDHHHL